MANVKISNLPSGAVAATSLIAHVTSGVTEQDSALDVAALDALGVKDQTNPSTGTRSIIAGGDAVTDMYIFKNNSANDLFCVAANGTVWANGAGFISTNTAFGQEALDANTSGTLTTAFGYQALSANTTNDGSTAIGSKCLSASLGTNNTGVGGGCMQHISTGNGNTAFGRDAGRYYTGGAGNQNTTGTDSLFFGNNTRPAANGETNQVVIGSDVTGNGANTSTIGNSSTVGTFLMGAVVIAEYTVATLPTASTYQAGMIMVTDETGGYTQAFSDGTNWRRVQDRAIVS